MSTNNPFIDEDGIVMLVDPNQLNINPNHTNAIPEYEDMHLSVELTARRRGRSIIMTSGGEITTEGDPQVLVSLMGDNQDKGDPNYGSFTTNWHDLDSGDSGQSETFGITNITIKTNTSFIPQVNIQFTDIRGYSFFNNENSPYRIIFDFPPPIFTLKVKGYYGKTLTYLLHLVKYTSSFNSDTGNYVIDGDFVALTYAPLADVLFRYAINLPLISNDYDYNTSVDSRPINTYDFLLKLKSLYNEIEKFENTTSETLSYDSAVTNLNRISSAKTRLNNFNNLDDLKRNVNGRPHLFIYTPNEPSEKTTVDRDDVSVIKSFEGYDRVLNSFDGNIPSNINTRLFMGYYTSSVPTLPGVNESQIKRSVEKYIENAIDNISNVENLSVQTLKLSYDLKNQTTTHGDLEYIVVDLTKTYVEFYKKWKYLEGLKSDAANRLNEKINDLIHKNLGMLPTIYNVFELIMNDVDFFFKKLWKTSREAEIKHNEKLARLILDDPNYKDSENKIYAFPLIVKKERSHCGEEIEVRSSPIEFERMHKYNFPELELVDSFIESFVRQNKLETLLKKREETDDNNQNIWIPMSSLDSNLLSSANSPYAFILRSSVDDIYKTVLERFYILTQYVFGDFFQLNEYSKIFELTAEAEGVNLANSIIESKTAHLLKEQSKNFKNNVDGFYSYLKNNLNSLYGFTSENRPESFRMSQRDTSDKNVYTPKDNENFFGLTIYQGDVSIRDENITTETENLVKTFINKSTPRRSWSTFFRRRPQDGFDQAFSLFEITNENLLYFQDKNDGDVNYRQGLGGSFYHSPNLGQITPVLTNDKIIGDVRSSGIKINKDELISHLFANGNRGFLDKKIGSLSIKLIKKSVDISAPLIFYIYTLKFNELDDIKKQNLLNFLINTESEVFDEDLSDLIILSLFGNITSPFTNIYNETLFKTPMVVEVPWVLVYYLGCLVYFSEEDETTAEFNKENKLINFFNSNEHFDMWNEIDKFTEKTSSNFRYVVNNAGVRIAADFFDVKNNLSNRDKKTLLEFYLAYKNSGNGNNSRRLLKKMIENPNSIEDDVEISTTGRRIDLRTKYNPSGGDSNTIRVLTDKVHLLVHSDMTFSVKKDLTPFIPGYNSIEFLSQIEGRKNIIDNYFETFFNSLYEKLDIKDLEEEERLYNERFNDNDIRTQTYYSFKNINDKWLSGIDGIITNPEINTDGYPFGVFSGINRDGNSIRRLINSFAFVDRTMSPIGDTIIDPEILLDILNSPDTTIFTAISQLLSTNGFEFFPLQNFMTHEREDWVDSFKIDVMGDSKFSPVFVCMYIGGTSSYPTGINTMSSGEFNDDGIVNLLQPGVNDFSFSECYETENDNDRQKETNEKFPYRQVRAFRVRFGEQNQSMFFDIKIEGNEFPETNESIQILSRIAGDNKTQAPIPKGQNLYNLYENRAYSTTITMLGNMMIQPSQYFQLENVPLFDGAYIILNVEHDIKPNFITTTFEGTKILKYPIPRVKEPFAVFGYDGGTSEVGDYSYENMRQGTPVEFMGGPFMVNPVTPLIIRNDNGGDGRWLARRGANRRHEGVDFSTEVGQEIRSPIGGSVTNVLSNKSKIPMVVITPNNEDARPEYYQTMEILYITPPNGIPYNKSRNIRRGDVIGVQMDLKEQGYSDNVTPHIHVQLRTKNGGRINPTGFFSIDGVQ